MFAAHGPLSRLPAVADQFYPADEARLRLMVDKFLAQAKPVKIQNIKAMIVPHAGYIYSASIAASAYQALSLQTDIIRQVILIGPSHKVGFEGIASCSANQYQMPLGAVEINRELLDKINTLPQVHERNEAHEFEHSLEVQLPFLQTVLKHFTMLPLVVGDCSAQEVSQVLDELWGGDETLIVVSSDLSHFLPYERANKMDALTSEAILQLNPEKINYEHACGRNPINGLLLSAKKHALKAQLMDLRNSGDTAGVHDRVVGYASFVFGEQ